MYIQKTKFYCPKCRRHDHWGDEVCSKENVDVSTGGEVVAVEQGEKGDEVSKREGNHSSGEDVLPREASEKDLERGDYPDARKAELRGKAVHQEVQKSRRAVPGKENPVEVAKDFIKRGRPKIYPDRKVRRKEYMRAYRAGKSGSLG